MKKIVPVTAFILLSFLSAAASAEPATRAIMPQGVHTLVTNDDYPEEAIRNDEQGIVAFRLDIGSNGLPTGCSVTESSGSSMLDATTCRILMERARFQPARGANGKPTTDSFTSRVRWVLPDSAPAREDAMTQLWTSCVVGEAAKFVTSALTVEEIVRRSFPPCASLEVMLSREVKQALPLHGPRQGVVLRIEEGVAQIRNALGAPPAEDPTEGPV